ncbi:hypothetical protein SBRCBS47491_005291 [Sporothrix bragantina]|uniref:Uncharacterized protein n=1 Tax=Sporothrix bragantina TaxID=671064 RepID=A0ABP0BXK3_9PEZI
MDDDLEMQAYKLLIEPTSAPPVRGTRPASKMTPNTRFLSHIVREAKSHNAALLARETADAHKRLKRLMRKDGDNNNEFVGPRLASDRLVESSSDSAGVRIRGRGAHSAAAPGFSNSMDRHFAADYDPTKDVEHPLPAPRPEVAPRSTAEDEDTEMQDDRKQLLRDSSERLRKAGFTDREIAILARGGRRRPDYTPWAKRGEAREWDRDKVEGDEGPAKPAWAR